MFTVILVIHVFIAIGLVGLVLIQHGKGADAGAAFGSGSSATVFGSQGSASFLTRLTAVLATSFFISSMSLAYFTREAVREGQEANISIPAEKSAAPVVPDITEIPAIPLDKDIPAVPGAKPDKAGSPDPTQIPE